MFYLTALAAIIMIILQFTPLTVDRRGRLPESEALVANLGIQPDTSEELP